MTRASLLSSTSHLPGVMRPFVTIVLGQSEGQIADDVMRSGVYVQPGMTLTLSPLWRMP